MTSWPSLQPYPACDQLLKHNYYLNNTIIFPPLLPELVNFLKPIGLVPMFINEPPTLIDELEPFFLLLKSETEPPTFSLGNEFGKIGRCLSHFLTLTWH